MFCLSSCHSYPTPFPRSTPFPRLQGGAGEGVEDPAAVAAAIVEDRLAMTAMDAEPVAAASWAAQVVGVEGLEEASVAGVLVHQFGDREVHRRCPPV